MDYFEHKKIHNVISIALLLLILFQSTGYLVIFKVQQQQIRREIKSRIKAGVSEDELVLLKFPTYWREVETFQCQFIKDHEFRYNGTMYDIVRQVTRGDSTWYYCLTDEKETFLFAQLDELVKRDMNNNTERNQQRENLLRLLHTFFCNQPEDPLFISVWEDYKLPRYIFNLNTWYNTPQTPPPQSVSLT